MLFINLVEILMEPWPVKDNYLKFVNAAWFFRVNSFLFPSFSLIIKIWLKITLQMQDLKLPIGHSSVFYEFLDECPPPPIL